MSLRGRASGAAACDVLALAGPMVRARRLLLALASSAALLSCLSPTLPLPPPEPQVSPPDAGGEARLQGTVPPNALAQAINTRTNRIAGQVTDQTGRYDFTIQAQIGDELTFYYIKGGEESMFVTVKVPAK